MPTVRKSNRPKHPQKCATTVISKQSRIKPAPRLHATSGPITRPQKTASPSATALTLDTVTHDPACCPHTGDYPAYEDIVAQFRTTVFGGAMSGGDTDATWRRPKAWVDLVDALSSSNATGASFAMPSNAGEYNRVYFPSENTKLDIPVLHHPDGRPILSSEIALRITRSDGSPPLNGDGRLYYRYKRQGNILRELWYTLHAAAHNLGPACHAAFIFEAPLGVGEKMVDAPLYGALYVMERVAHTVTEQLIRPIRELAIGGNTTKTTKPTHRALKQAGKLAIQRLLPLLCRQSRLGVVSFDVKPSNLMFNVCASSALAIDCDAAMYVLRSSGVRRTSDAPDWHAHLLVHLVLLSAHVRRFFPHSICVGWVEVLRKLILELVVVARGTTWPYTAQIRPCHHFEEILSSTDDACRRRLEMMVAIYFVNQGKNDTDDTDGLGLKPCGGAYPPSLIEQLVRYVLNGVADVADAQIDKAFGRLH